VSSERAAVATSIQLTVLIEAGYRCGVPTCRNILALDLHHVVHVSEGGGNEPAHLIALCPTSHTLHHRGTTPREAIRVWKALLVSLSQAFDTKALDQLLFLHRLRPRELGVSGDGVLEFSRLIGAGLAEFRLLVQNGPLLLYEVMLTPKGRLLVDAWRQGNLAQLTTALSTSSPCTEPSKATS